MAITEGVVALIVGAAILFLIAASIARNRRRQRRFELEAQQGGHVTMVAPAMMPARPAEAHTIEAMGEALPAYEPAPKYVPATT